MSTVTTPPPGPRRGPRLGPVAVGVLFLFVIAVGVFFGFSKRVPFKHHYTVIAVVRTSNLVAKNSPVRIAGVNIGKVVGTGRYGHSDLAEIRMQINGPGRPIRRDASIKVRPRLFLEGNFYIDLQPGTPDQPEMPDGGIIPVTRTAVPVQLDQVLATLQTDTRKALQQTVSGLGDAFDSKPSAAEDATQDPAVRGLTGGQALNATLETSPAALRDSAAVLQALRGRNNGDLSKAIEGIGDVTSALANDQNALKGVVRNFDTTVTATADNASSLTAAVRGLATTATVGKTAFAQLRRAIPPTRVAARDVAAGMDELPAVITAGRPWLRQAGPLVSQAELRGLLDQVQPTLSNAARLTHQSRTWIPRIAAFSQCLNKVFLPTAMIKVNDGALSAGVENYKEFWYALVGMAGEGQTFDGNGSKLRLQTAGGATKIETGKMNYNPTQPQFANLTSPSTGTSPSYSPTLPVVRTDVPCAKNGVPPINGSASKGPADGSQPNAKAPALPDLDPIAGSGQ